MKFRKNIFLEVTQQKISSIEFSKHLIFNKLYNISNKNTYYKDDSNTKKFQIDIKNKNLYVLVEGENVYIRLVTLPIVRKYLIHDMIKNELRYYYKDIDQISFTYKLIKEDKINMEILVFCLKGNNLDMLEDSINNVTFKKVNLIQFCFKNFYANKIHVKNYIMVFYYNSNLYYLICNNNEIVANNSVSVKEVALSKFSESMNEFLEQYNDYAKSCEKIYYSNISQLDIESDIKKFEYLQLSHQILDELKREELLKYIILKG
ncbi:hypothetical protein [Clostridium estertheticum]|uniref:hypothetical protein n=1 Tax=Clostridium estertheticum TaxID=238834 RepID=UPI001CF33124|nr:hypothetical protein [Clostridium estertheticum]MCB2359290.1 hypothetical protein [Clostridium estertheticum]